jgi:hypothetical protein
MLMDDFIPQTLEDSNIINHSIEHMFSEAIMDEMD